MAILVMCTNPQCGELFDAPDQAGGTQVACPSCGTMLAIASDPNAPPAEAAQPEAIEIGPSEVGPQQPQEAADLAPLQEDSTGQSPPPAAPDPVPSTLPDLKPLEVVDIDDNAAPPRSQLPMDPALLDTGGIDLSPQEEKPEGPVYDIPDVSPALAAPPVDTDVLAELQLEAEETFARGTSLAEGDVVQPDTSARHVDDGVLESRKVVAVPFVIGLMGIASGLAIGLYMHPDHPVLGAYMGSAVGWIVGFIFALMMVFAIDKDNLRKVRCKVCDNIFPAGTDACAFCGSPLSTHQVSPLATDCMEAASYALSDKTSIYWMVMLIVVASLPMAGAYHFWRLSPNLPQWAGPTLVGVCGLIAICLGGYWFEFFGKAVRDTIARPGSRPSLPPFRIFKNIVSGITALLVALVYVVPIFTFPLLPLGMLAFGARGRRGLFDLSGAARVAWRYTRDFAILWLLLLLWLAAMALGIAVTMMIVYLLRGAVPQVGGVSQIAFSVIISSVATMIAAVVVCVFGLAMFRCVALFARYNPQILKQVGRVTEAAQAMTGGDN